MKNSVWDIEATEAKIPNNYNEISINLCPDCQGQLTIGEWECLGQCSKCYEILMAQMPNDF